MSDLNEETVKLLGQLCRIELSDEEAASLFHDLKRILDYIDLLQEADVSHLNPYSHMDDIGVRSLREDAVGAVLPRETFLANAPDQVGGMVRVPPVIKQNV